MKHILILGVDSVIGANIAATLSDRYRAAGVSLSAPVRIADCETFLFDRRDAAGFGKLVEAFRPEWMIYCPALAVSAWQNPEEAPREESYFASRVATCANSLGCPLALISSDAIFTSPWIFHNEESVCYCASKQAASIRELEASVARACPSALVVRTHAYGWAPGAAGLGWIEKTLAELETGCAGPYNSVGHATPLLAGDLAEILEQALEQELTGAYHIAGAERTNPARFVEQLAEVFELPAPRSSRVGPLGQRPQGFGSGETSLQTRKIRQTLGISLPLVAEGLQRLCEQQTNGYRERFAGLPHPVRQKVA